MEKDRGSDLLMERADDNDLMIALDTSWKAVGYSNSVRDEYLFHTLYIARHSLWHRSSTSLNNHANYVYC